MTYPFPNVNGCNVEASEWEIISSYTLLGMWLLIHSGIKIYLHVQAGPIKATNADNGCDYGDLPFACVFPNRLRAMQ